MATHREIAKLAGCGTGTVSDILAEREGKRYTDDMRERVRAAALELGYSPNRLARGLIHGRTNTVGLILPDLANPFYATIAKSVSAPLRAEGYSLILEEAPVAETPAVEAAALDVLAGFRVDGIVAMPVHPAAHEKFFRDQARRGMAASILGGGGLTGDFPADLVGLDLGPGIREAVGLLAADGRRRFAYLGSLPWAHVPGTRFETIRTTLRELDLSAPDVVAIPCEHHPAAAAAAFARFFNKTPARKRPAALFVINDDLAIAALRAALDLGLRVPDDLAVVSFDNTPLGASLPLALSSIGGDLFVLANSLSASLLRRLKNPDAALPPQRSRLVAAFHSRETTPGGTGTYYERHPR